MTGKRYREIKNRTGEAPTKAELREFAAAQDRAAEMLRPLKPVVENAVRPMVATFDAFRAAADRPRTVRQTSRPHTGRAPRSSARRATPRRSRATTASASGDDREPEPPLTAGETRDALRALIDQAVRAKLAAPEQGPQKRGLAACGICSHHRTPFSDEHDRAAGRSWCRGWESERRRRQRAVAA
jgi:hypothetical protein